MLKSSGEYGQMSNQDKMAVGKYEGDSICNEIVTINQKVLYLNALQLHSQKGLLLGYTTAKSQLSGSFTTLHNLLSRKGTKLHCDTNLSSGYNSEYCMS